MKLTLHAAMSLNDGSEIDHDQILELEPEISDYVWTLLGDFQETYSPFAHRCQGAIYEYLYEIDPIGLRDEKAQNNNEYFFEASVIFWLLNHDRLSEKAIWAIWIFYFSRDISPYKEVSHPVLGEMLKKSKEIYQASSTGPID
jgi:hypothetical protein